MSFMSKQDSALKFVGKRGNTYHTLQHICRAETQGETFCIFRLQQFPVRYGIFFLKLEAKPKFTLQLRC